MYVISAHQRHRQTDGQTPSDGMTATLLKHVAVKKNSTVRPVATVARPRVVRRKYIQPVSLQLLQPSFLGHRRVR